METPTQRPRWATAAAVALFAAAGLGVVRALYVGYHVLYPPHGDSYDRTESVQWWLVVTAVQLMLGVGLTLTGRGYLRGSGYAGPLVWVFGVGSTLWLCWSGADPGAVDGAVFDGFSYDPNNPYPFLAHPGTVAVWVAVVPVPVLMLLAAMAVNLFVPAPRRLPWAGGNQQQDQQATRNVALPGSPPDGDTMETPTTRPRWVVAVAVLLFVAAGLGLVRVLAFGYASLHPPHGWASSPISPYDGVALVAIQVAAGVGLTLTGRGYLRGSGYARPLVWVFGVGSIVWLCWSGDTDALVPSLLTYGNDLDTWVVIAEEVAVPVSVLVLLAAMAINLFGSAPRPSAPGRRPPAAVPAGQQSGCRATICDGQNKQPRTRRSGWVTVTAALLFLVAGLGLARVAYIGYDVFSPPTGEGYEALDPVTGFGLGAIQVVISVGLGLCGRGYLRGSGYAGPLVWALGVCSILWLGCCGFGDVANGGVDRVEGNDYDWDMNGESLFHVWMYAAEFVIVSLSALALLGAMTINLFLSASRQPWAVDANRQ